MRHRYLLLLPGLLLARPALAQTNRVAVKPPLTHVTVYLNGTTLEHQTPVLLAVGLNRVIVSGLSPRLKADNMQMQLGDGAELLPIDDNDEQLPPAAPLNPTAVDSLKRADAERRTLEGELDGLKQEKTFLLDVESHGVVVYLLGHKFARNYGTNTPRQRPHNAGNTTQYPT